MEKIKEIYVKTTSDYDSLLEVFDTLEEYPTKKGYRVEAYYSPKFVRITIYKEETKMTMDNLKKVAKVMVSIFILVYKLVMVLIFSIMIFSSNIP